MNKAELIKSIEASLGSRKAATDALDAVLDAIVREVSKGGKVAITGFGTFEKAARAARTGRNPQTGEPVKIPKTSVPRFKAATSFKGYVANPTSLPKAAPAVARAAAGTVASAVDTAAKVAGLGGGAAARRSSAATSSASKSTGSKSTAPKKTASKKTASKKTASKSTAAKSTSSTAKKTPAKKTSSSTAKTTPAKKTAKKSAS